jgi:hypothetical protein
MPIMYVVAFYKSRVSAYGPAVLTPTSEWAFAHMKSGWCARRIQTIYTGSGRRMPYVQWGEEFCIALHRGACSRGLQVGERGRSSQVSKCVSVERSLAMSLSCVSIFLLSVPFGMVHAFPFYRCKGNTRLHACATWCLP